MATHHRRESENLIGEKVGVMEYSGEYSGGVFRISWVTALCTWNREITPTMNHGVAFISGTGNIGHAYFHELITSTCKAIDQMRARKRCFPGCEFDYASCKMPKTSNTHSIKWSKKQYSKEKTARK